MGECVSARRFRVMFSNPSRDGRNTPAHLYYYIILYFYYTIRNASVRDCIQYFGLRHNKTHTMYKMKPQTIILKIKV